MPINIRYCFLPYPLNNSWGYHDACSGNGKYDIYYDSMAARYGKPNNLKDFSIKMQLMNATGYRGIFEAAAHKLDETGGVMLWKLNAAFPSVIWQVYDWYLEPNAGYYFMQRACEPVHIQLNLDDSSVALINRTYSGYSGLQYQVEIVDINGKSLFHKEGKTKSDTTSAKEILNISNTLRNIKGISFVILKLEDSEGKLLSHNVYWMSPAHQFTGLKEMPKATLDVKVISSQKKSNYNNWTIRFTNSSSRLAFFLNPQIINNGEEVLPSYWSDNYFSVPAGNSLTVTVSCPMKQFVSANTQLRLEGWNIETKNIDLAPSRPKFIANKNIKY